ncbi:hypothetical protein HDU92_005564 [Lobulomyces angularis]|nr:hypothetical protein HDU92_005564 [Lobulomyces angularis]
MSTYTVKSSFKESVRKFIVEEVGDFKTFEAKIKGVHDIPLQKKVTLSYLDEDNDFITFDTDSELTYLLNTEKSIKVFVNLVETVEVSRESIEEEDYFEIKYPEVDIPYNETSIPLNEVSITDPFVTISEGGNVHPVEEKIEKGKEKEVFFETIMDSNDIKKVEEVNESTSTGKPIVINFTSGSNTENPETLDRNNEKYSASSESENKYHENSSHQPKQEYYKNSAEEFASNLESLINQLSTELPPILTTFAQQMQKIIELGISSAVNVSAGATEQAKKEGSRYYEQGCKSFSSGKESCEEVRKEAWKMSKEAQKEALRMAREAEKEAHKAAKESHRAIKEAHKAARKNFSKLGNSFGTDFPFTHSPGSHHHQFPGQFPPPVPQSGPSYFFSPPPAPEAPFPPSTPFHTSTSFGSHWHINGDKTRPFFPDVTETETKNPEMVKIDDYEKQNKTLLAMGFGNSKLNQILLKEFKGNMETVIDMLSPQ